MRRDAAAEPTAVAASPPVAEETAGRSEVVVIDVEGEPQAQAPAVAPAGVACRICHLVLEGGDDPGSEVIRLGCGCKEELGAAHRHCAEAWFRIKGDRVCIGSCHSVMVLTLTMISGLTISVVRIASRLNRGMRTTLAIGHCNYGWKPDNVVIMHSCFYGTAIRQSSCHGVTLAI